MEQGHIACYRTATIEIRVTQDTRRVDGMGGEVWPGAHVLCAHLETNAGALKLKQARVLELGAGCGLCGLVASALGAPAVVLSDEYPDMLERNIELNADWLTESVAVKTIEWGEQSQADETFDIVLGSEITQVGRKAHQPLVETIAWSLKTGGVALLSMDACNEDCQGVCDITKCTASHFSNIARTNGFTVTKHPSIKLTSLESITQCVGALGRPWPLDGTEYSAVFELRKA
ncbi:hypothetical protein LEN26_005076 [Aphanomyces euteiches]|nr:hypothetical protein LEN26_005076 [Aphanomyces euteiches]